MDKLENFKSIADEMMCEISVSEDLKRKTLAHCKKKKFTTVTKILIPAACIALMLGCLNHSGVLHLKSHTAKEKSNDYGVLMESSDGAATKMAGAPESAQGSTALSGVAANSWTINTTEEARETFGPSYLTPSYIPKGFQLDQIQACGPDEKNVNNITLSFISGEKSFFIMEEKSASQEAYSDFEKISINDSPGYLSTSQTINETGGNDSYSELHWFKSEIHYSVSGQLTKEETVSIAKGLTNK
jgi:hypothetical protein